jgi:hypothetical protein
VAILGANRETPNIFHMSDPSPYVQEQGFQHAVPILTTSCRLIAMKECVSENHHGLEIDGFIFECEVWAPSQNRLLKHPDLIPSFTSEKAEYNFKHR